MNQHPNDNDDDNNNLPKQREPTEADKQRIDAIIQALRDQTITMPPRSASTDLQASKTHAFWDTQPMFRTHEIKAEQELHAPLIPNKPKEELRQTPYNMPRGFEWTEIDITNQEERHQVYELLNKNYVEDDECMFRFDYSHDFLQWALTPPGYLKAFHLGVRSSSKGALVAFISAVPATVRSYDKTFPSVEINFLCVHKKLRSKRLAPVLIKEITRRVNLTGVFQAVYTAGIVLPGPVSSCRYYHRTLNPKKLVEVGFTSVPPKMTMARFCKNYKVPCETSIAGLRPMEKGDVSSACKLLKRHLDQFQLVIEFSEEDFQHWFLPRKDVITTYVVTNDEDGQVSDMISYYHLHSSIQKNESHSHLRAAYSFYNVATSVDLEDLMRNALILAKKEDMDVFNALEQMKNKDFFDALKFGKGDGMLQYYLYNWCCPTMEPKDVGIVLL
jgi:glycylpeptide N-tetradecanoyltransferase